MYHYKATVKRVIDGDTLELLVDVGFCIALSEKFRLLGINTPELSTQEGKDIKQLMINMLDGQEVEVRSEGKDKYGRWLGIIYYNNKNINTWLLDQGYAVEYMVNKNK